MEYHHHPLPYEYEKPPPPAVTADPYHHHHHHHHPPPMPLTADLYYIHHHQPPPPPLATDTYYLPQPPASQAPVIAAPNPDIHTIFISGLPDDVKAREIHNLFRRRPGFDTCLLEYTGRGNQVVAYATFSSPQSAVSAMAELNGVIFDAETGATLHIELARSNSRRRPRGDVAYDIIDKRTWSSDGKGGSDEPSGTENDNSSKKGAASQRKRKADAALGAQDGQSEKPSSGAISPCSTLFIANLSPSCTEEELKQILSECCGFQVLKMRKKFGKPVAFADFSFYFCDDIVDTSTTLKLLLQDVESATECKEKLLGISQHAADDAGLHLEYARAKMRKS